MFSRSQTSKLTTIELSNSLEEQAKLPAGEGAGNWLENLKVGQKIILGYGLILGIVVVGTVGGFGIAHQYQQEALREEEDAIQELYQVYRLKSAVSRVRSEQHKLILYMDQPELWQDNYAQMMDYTAEVEQEWIDFQTTFRNPSRRLKDSEQEKRAYDQIMQTKSEFDNYLEQAEIIFLASDPANIKPAAIDATQIQLLNFMHDAQVFTLDQFLNDIADLVNVTAAEYEEAKADHKRAERLRIQAVGISLLLSSAIATLLAIYINRAITGPIKAVTYVAQQVTEEANFDLQASVTTRDEIGILATSLNRLIQEVQQLLETQKDTNEQLAIYSGILEKKVQERTRELREKNRSLQQALEALNLSSDKNQS